MSVFALFVLALVSPSFGAVTLEQYNIDPSSVTLSGISSGAAFATQYHVIHSNSVKGAATFAGVVYHCANGIAATALLCMGSPGLTDVTDLIDKTRNLAGKGDIDSTTGMSGDKVFVFAGSLDTVVDPVNGNQIVEFYNSFGSSIKSEFSVAAEHCQPTDGYGPSCNYLGGEYINDCTYNGAFEAMNYMYGNSLTRPDGSVSPNGDFYEFDQREFYPLSSPGTYSADTSGYVYIPSGCIDKSKTCKLHLAFHGCQQGKEVVGDSFAVNSGYLEVAEANDIIILFPQVTKNLVLNPQGCWDWWGYTGITIYATKSGIQVKATEGMINRLIG